MSDATGVGTSALAVKVLPALDEVRDSLPQSRRWLIGVSSLGIALALAGCGTNAASVAETASPHPAAITRTPTPGDPKSAAFLKGLADRMLAAGSVHTEQTSPIHVVGSFVKDGTDADYNIAMLASTGQTQVVVRAVKGMIYVSIPSQMGQGKFAKVDPSSGGVASLLSSVSQMQPGESLVTVAPAVESMRDAGTAMIDGQRAHHYVFVINALKAHELLNPGVAIPDDVMKKLKTNYEYNLYLGANGLVRKVTIDVLGKPTIINYTDWGSRVHIAAPPASSLVTAPGI